MSAESAINIEIEETPLEMIFSVTAPYQIKILSIVITNCNKIEVYTDKFEEYLKTIYGEFLDDVEDIKTYAFNLNLDTMVDQVMLRMVTHSKQFWIYGANLKVLNSFDLKNPYCSIDMQNVQKILNDSNVKLTENARKCQGFLESYMANADPTLQMQTNPKVLTDIVNQSLNEAIQTKFDKIFNDEIKKFINSNQVQEAETSEAFNLNPMLQTLKNPSPQNRPNLQAMLDSLPAPRPRPSLEEMMQMISKAPVETKIQTPPDVEMRTFIQEEFQKLETNITAKLDDFEKRQEEKFNEILKKLDDFNSKG